MGLFVPRNTFHCARRTFFQLACAAALAAPSVAQAADPGLDARVPIGPYFNGVLPDSALNQSQMPTLLSSTGVFTDMVAMTPNPAMVPFTVNSALWSDASEKLRWMVLPFDGTIGGPGSPAIAFSPEGKWVFPNGTVWVKHFQIKVNEQTNEIKRLETRFMVRDNEGNLYGNSYRWNSAQTDATIVTAFDGEREPITITRANGTTESQTWHYPGPGQCLECHNNANPSDPNGTGQSLGVKTRQLNGNYTYAATGRTANQLLTWSKMGMLSPALADQADYPEYEKLVPLNDTTATLEKRVRSYVDSNCSYCHGGGTSPGPIWDARYTTPLLNQNIAHHPTLNPLGVLRRFDIDNSRLRIRDGVDPRVASFPLPMPPLARNVPHAEWLAVMSAYANYAFDTTSAIAVGNPNQIRLQFDRAVDPATATVASNYTVNNGITVSAAAIDPMDATQVLLTVSAMTNNAAYRVTVNRVREAQGVMNPIWPNTFETFTYLSTPLAQSISFAMPADRFHTDGPFAVAATGGASGNPVIFTSLTPAVCSASGANGSTIVLTQTPGLCTLAANQAGSAMYAAAAQVTRSFKVLWRVNVVLEGSQQVPPVLSQAQGGGTATYDATTRMLALNLSVSGLESAETMAHIHGPAARGANSGVLFDLNTGSSKVQTVMLDTTQETQLLAGQLYVNVHTTGYPGGEVRGQLDALGSVGLVVLVELEGQGASVEPSYGGVQFSSFGLTVWPGSQLQFMAPVDIYEGENASGVWTGCDSQVFSDPLIPNAIGAKDALCQVTVNSSRVIAVSFGPPGAPSKPINIVAVPLNGAAQVSFALSTSSLALQITYEVICDSAMGSVTAQGGSSPIVITLVNDRTYECRVYAFTSAGSSPHSRAVTVTPFMPFALETVKSRKAHKDVGSLDLDIALGRGIGDAISIEPRAGPHKLVFQFNKPVTAVGTITMTDKDGANTVRTGHKVVGNTIELPLDDLGDNLRVAVAIAGVNGTYTANVALGFLQGDINDSRRVTAADVITLKRRRNAAPVDAASARFDLNLDGVVSDLDVNYAKNRAGRMVP
ncbi:MAG: CHRD domain-containing protein [Betaproteobacteria bacterium]|nr:CHRD domain-containing protein [Betaproteobacteria bacterium]